MHSHPNHYLIPISKVRTEDYNVMSTIAIYKEEKMDYVRLIYKYARNEGYLNEKREIVLKKKKDVCFLIW